MPNRNVLSIGNTKTMKGGAKGYLTGILHFAPGDLSGHQVCSMASEGCLAACLNTAGRGRFDKIQDARIAKTRRFFEDREAFLADLVWSVKALERKARREGTVPVVRLNGTSDLPWEKIRVEVDGENYRSIMHAFPHIQFYDYTKIAARASKWAMGFMPENYHLTFSRSEDESNHAECAGVLAAGGNVAMVFDQLPTEYMGYPVVDGDKTDLRFEDPKGCIVGLKAKGEGKADTSGFVVRLAA